jgi:hypothetical protein
VPKHAKSEISRAGLQGDMEYGRFAGFLYCELGFCGEVVVVSGQYRREFQYDEGYDGEEVQHSITDHYVTRMTPAPHMIEIPKALSEECSTQIKEAFELFWVDLAACANRLRIAVELLLDFLSIARLAGRKTLTLHERIDLLDTAKPGHKEILTALRHVGNVASHEGEVNRGFVLDCFELLEESLVELVEDRRAKLTAKAQRIIAGKGKPTP